MKVSFGRKRFFQKVECAAAPYVKELEEWTARDGNPFTVRIDRTVPLNTNDIYFVLLER